MTSSLPFVPERVTFDTAAAHACTQVPIATPISRIGDIHQALVGQRYESATHIVVCDAGKFCGILRLEDVLAASADTLASTVMDTDPPVVAPGVDQEVAAW